MGLKDQFMGPAMALLGNASIDDIISQFEQMRSVINKVSQPAQSLGMFQIHLTGSFFLAAMGEHYCE